MSPQLFEEYAIPFYKQASEILKDSGILLEAHWCGRTDVLLKYLPQTGIDVVEAISTVPMSKIKLSEALDILDEKVVLQGGIPAVLLCSQTYSTEEFYQYIENTILPLKDRRCFVLGMGDNVPPDAEFSRVEQVAKMIR